MPDSDVKVRITTEDKTQQGTKSAEDQFKKFGGTLNDVAQELTGFNLAQLSVAGAIGLVANEVKKTVDEYSNYVESIDKLSSSTGMQTEELSRLIQVADDFRVSEGAITAAMNMALQNGFVPSIENIARLADETNAMTDTTERASRLQEVFGKQWKEITPLLERGGRAIRDGAAGIGDGLVVTSDAIEANRRYQASVDNLNDSWTEFKYNITKDIVPALATMIEAVNASVAAQQKGVGRNEFIANQKALREGSEAAKEWASDEREAAKAAQTTNKAVEQQTKATGAASWQMDAYRESVDQSAQATDEIAAKQIKYEESVKRVEDGYKDLQDATKSATEAQKSFNESFGDKAASSLSKYAGEGKKYREGLAIQDKVLGTNSAAAYDAQKSLDELNRKFAAGAISSDEYAKGLEKQKPAWEALDAQFNKAKDALQQARNAWSAFYAGLAEANGQHFQVDVSVNYSGGGGNAANTGAGGRAGQTGKVCFVGETPVNTPTGYRCIRDIQPGDLVYTFTEAGELQPSVVTRNAGHYRDDLLRVRTSDRQEFSVSPDHPWAVRQKDGGHKFVETIRLKPMDRLISMTGLPVWVVEVTDEPGTFEVFDLSVLHAEHTFLVGGLVVHNKAVTGGATGLDMTVPANYPNDSYMVGASSNERVLIGTPEFVRSASGGTSGPAASGSTTINNVFNISSTDPKAAAREVMAIMGQQVRNASRSGAGSAGVL